MQLSTSLQQAPAWDPPLRGAARGSSSSGHPAAPLRALNMSQAAQHGVALHSMRCPSRQACPAQGWLQSTGLPGPPPRSQATVAPIKCWTRLHIMRRPCRAGVQRVTAPGQACMCQCLPLEGSAWRLMLAWPTGSPHRPAQRCQLTPGRHHTRDAASAPRQALSQHEGAGDCQGLTSVAAQHRLRLLDPGSGRVRAEIPCL